MRAEGAQPNYLTWFGCAFAAGILTVALFNAVVDPVGIFGLVERRGFNLPKARPERDIAQLKLFAAVRVQPDVLILGNSRAEVGFDPQHPGWASIGSKVYNLAVPGADIERSVGLLEAMCSIHEPRFVMVGLDFMDFLVPPDRLGTYRARAGAAPHTRPALRDRVLALVTADALVDSIRTIRAQRLHFPEIITEGGFNPLLEYVPMARDGGYYPLFQQRLIENAKAFSRTPVVVGKVGAHESPAAQSLRSLIRTARSCGSKLLFVTYPYHSQYLTLIREAGLWPQFEEWKRLIAAVVADEASRDIRIPLWDFAYFSEASMEQIPSPGDYRTVVKWYWEGGHFKKELGDQLLRQVLGEQQKAPEGAVLVARELRPATAEHLLRELHEQESAFREQHPEVVDQVRKVLKDNRKDRG